jgi:hypothetical protein
VLRSYPTQGWTGATRCGRVALHGPAPANVKYGFQEAVERYRISGLYPVYTIRPASIKYGFQEATQKCLRFRCVSKHNFGVWGGAMRPHAVERRYTGRRAGSASDPRGAHGARAAVPHRSMTGAYRKAHPERVSAGQHTTRAGSASDPRVRMGSELGGGPMPSTACGAMPSTRCGARPSRGVTRADSE